MNGRYDALDPRFGPIRQNITANLTGPFAPDYARLVITNLYYSGSGVNRTGETTEADYHTSIQTAVLALNPAPSEIVHQTNGNPWPTIPANEIAQTLNNDNFAFIHIRKTPGVGTTRLYIPCNLARASAFFARLWKYGGLTKFKVVGFGDATDRADVIVAWFQHNQHARTVGDIFDAIYSADMSGSMPVGAFACSNARLCGWAPENGSSVGTDAINDLTNWWLAGSP